MSENICHSNKKKDKFYRMTKNSFFRTIRPPVKKETVKIKDEWLNELMSKKMNAQMN